MDTKTISQGPSIKDLQDSLTRKSIDNVTHEMLLVQCVAFRVGHELWYVLMSGLERESGDGESWLYKGRIIQKGKKKCEGWIPCHGYFSTKHRTGWLEETYA